MADAATKKPSGALSRWWRQQFDQALRAGAAHGAFSPAFAKYIHVHGLSFQSVIDYVDQLRAGHQRAPEADEGDHHA